MNLKVSYTITEKMQIDSAKQYFNKCLLGNKIYLIILFPISSILLFLLPLTIADFLPKLFLIVFFVLVIMWIKTYFVLINQAKVQLKILDSNEVCLEINDDEIIYKSSNGTKNFRWEKIDQIIECKDFIILQKEKLPLINIPKAFVKEAGVNFIKDKVQKVNF